MKTISMKPINKINQIESCEVCGNEALLPVLDLGMNPMCDDLVEIGSSRVCEEYPIEILFCKVCRTAHQKYQIPKTELFPKSYHYRSRFTSDVLDGMKGLVGYCEREIGLLAGKKVLDIGCNDGSLLDFFKQKGALTIGIEPTDAYTDAEMKGHKIFNEYLNVTIAEEIELEYGKPDIITFTNVFAHIEDLRSVLQALKILLHDKTIIVIENHYLGSVLKGYQFDTFYHEHPRTYSYQSFKFISKSLGLNVLSVEFPSRYGGNIRVTMGNGDYHVIKGDFDEELTKMESLFYNDFLLMVDKIFAWKNEMKVKISDYVSINGKIKAKAFPGRAAILVKQLGLNEEIILAAYEKPGSMKINHYIPGTRIPILSDDELFENISDEKFILNFAWHIENEIGNYLTENGFEGELLSVL